MNLRDFPGVGTKLKESTVKNNNQINFTVLTKNMSVANCRIGIQMKKMVVVLICLSGRCCSSGCVVLYRVNKDEGDESAFSSFSKTYCQCNFSKIFKERHIIFEPCKNLKYPIRYLL